MSKGKKFDAAEKNFEKKKFQLEKRIKYLTEENYKYISDNEQYKKQIENLTNQNQQLEMEIKKLFGYAELNNEEIRKDCERDVCLNEFASQFPNLYKYFLKFH